MKIGRKCIYVLTSISFAARLGHCRQKETEGGEKTKRETAMKAVMSSMTI